MVRMLRYICFHSIFQKMVRCLLLLLIVFWAGQVSAQVDSLVIEEDNIDWVPDSLAVQEEEKVYEMFILHKPATFRGGDRAAEIFLDKQISYPFIEWLFGQEGVVSVIFVAKRDGNIAEVKIEKPSKSRFNHQVLKAMKKLPRFVPGESGGHPPMALYRYVVEFRQSGFRKAKTICTIQLLAVKYANADWQILKQ